MRVTRAEWRGENRDGRHRRVAALGLVAARPAEEAPVSSEARGVMIAARDGNQLACTHLRGQRERARQWPAGSNSKSTVLTATPDPQRAHSPSRVTDAVAAGFERAERERCRMGFPTARCRHPGEGGHVLRVLAIIPVAETQLAVLAAAPCTQPTIGQGHERVLATDGDGRTRIDGKRHTMDTTGGR